MSYLRVRCPRCWQTAKISEDKLGRQGMCNRCGSPVSIPRELTKVCIACGDEVTQVKHYKDQQNNYLCGDCYSQRKGAADHSAFSLPSLTCCVCHAVFSQGEGQERDGQPICRDCHRRDMPPPPPRSRSRKDKRREKRQEKAEGELTALADPDSVLSFLDTPDPHRPDDKSPPTNGEQAAEKPPPPAVDDTIRAQVEAEAVADEAEDRLAAQRPRTPPQPTPAPLPAARHDHDTPEPDTLISFDDDGPGRRTFTRIVTRASPFATFAAGGALLGVIVLLLIQLTARSTPDADDIALRAISLMAQAEAYCAAGRYEEGIRRYDRLMKYIDGKPATSAALSDLIEAAKADYQRAHEAYRQQQADEAEKLVARQREKQEQEKRQQEQEKLAADLRHAVASLQQTIATLRSTSQLPPIARTGPVEEVPVPPPPPPATVIAPTPATAPIQPPSPPATAPTPRNGKSIFDD